MKIVLLLFLVATVQTQSVTPNFTLPESLLNNLTNLIVDSLTNNSVTLTDVLTSDAVQELFNFYGYNDIAVSMDGLNDLVGLLNQLEKIQYFLDKVAAMDDECSRQITMLFNSFSKNDDWALRMLDASAKPQPGLLEGNTMLIGHYDECLKIDALVNGTQINGQYCTAYISDYIEESEIKLNQDSILLLKLSYGFCVPAVCDKQSLQRVIRLLEDMLDSPYHVNVVENLCISTVKTKSFSLVSILAIIFFTMIGIVVVLSTLYDVFFYQNNTYQRSDIYIAFSFYTNGQKLFSTNKSVESLSCLNGMRVISIAWIVAGHRFVHLVFLPLINLVEVGKWHTLPETSIISAGNMAVDTFFVISGLLVVYVYSIHKAKGHTPSLPMFYIHRIMRLAPPVVGIVLLYSAFLEHLGSGPFWPLVSGILERECKDYGWWTLLFVQNYVSPTNMCVGHAWYLAVDTQLYFLFPLLLFPLSKSPKNTLIMVLCLAATCCGLSFFISWEKNLQPAFFRFDNNALKYLYAATHVRAPSWLIGIVLGYFLFHIRNKKIVIKTRVVILLWSGALGTVMGIVAYHKRISDGLGTMSRLESALANSLIRPCWSLALSVIIFLCVTGYGGAINRFLSSSIFTVLIRINYSVYLVHMVVIVFALGQQKTPQNGSFRDTLYYFWGDLIFSSLLAIVWTLVFESPILALEKIIFGKRTPKKKTIEETPEQTFNNNISVVVIDDKLKKRQNIS